ncbi:MAG: caspase family protein [Rhodobacteraceae bacterium]|nr:caspase family protein [Paracoccaceae bacterium]
MTLSRFFAGLLPAVAIAVVSMLGAGAALAESRHALVIGNSSYAHTSALPNARNDAADMAARLRDLGFRVTEAQDQDAMGMRSTLQRFAREVVGADAALIFYAGHGMEMDGENWLIPVDARLQTDLDVEFEAISLSQLLGTVSRADGLKLVILDACRDNPFIPGMERRDSTRSVGRGLARVEPADGMLVAFAARAGQVAADGDGRNSPFTAAMLEVLAEPGVELGLMFRKVRDQVMQSTGRRQEPFTYGSLPSRSIYLNPPMAALDLSALPPRPDPVPVPVPVPAPQVLTQPTADPCTAARADWEIVREAGSLLVLEQFVRVHEGCPLFAALAEERIAALTAPPAPDVCAGAEAARALMGSSPDRALLSRFLDRFPECPPHSEAVRAALEDLRACEGAAAARSNLGPAPSRSDLEGFLRRFPSCEPHSGLMRTALEDLRRCSGVEAAYRALGPNPSEAELRGFLSRFPDCGVQSSGATSRLERAVACRSASTEWASLRNSSDRARIERFIAVNTGCTTELALARARLASLQPPGATLSEERSLGLSRAEVGRIRLALHQFDNTTFTPSRDPSSNGVLHETERTILERYYRERVRSSSPSRFLNRDASRSLLNASYSPRLPPLPSSESDYDRASLQRLTDWDSFRAGDGCYAHTDAVWTSSPVWQTPQLRLLTRRSYDGPRSININFLWPVPFDTDRPFHAQVGNTRYDLRLDGTTIRPAMTDDGRYTRSDVFKAMRAGRELSFFGTNAYTGEPLEIRYSLMGFSAAFNRMASMCNRSGILSWIQ